MYAEMQYTQDPALWKSMIIDVTCHTSDAANRDVTMVTSK